MVFELLSLIVMSLLSSLFFNLLTSTIGYFFVNLMYSELFILFLGSAFFYCCFLLSFFDFLLDSDDFSESSKILSYPVSSFSKMWQHIILSSAGS